MQRLVPLLLVFSLLISCLAVPAFAVDVNGSKVDLYRWNSDLTSKTSFVGSSALLDTEMDPFQGQILVTLPEQVEAGDYIDLELTFDATEGQYWIRSIELSSFEGSLFYTDPDFTDLEVDSGHILIQGLGVDEKFTYAFGVVYINYSVWDPEYSVQTNVINGTPTKQYGFSLSVSSVEVTPIGELGFFARILETAQQILASLSPSEGEKFLGIVDFQAIGDFFADAYEGVRSVFGLRDLIENENGPFSWLEE